MPTCKIQYKNKGFLIEEFFMQTMYCYIYHELIKDKYVFSKKDDLLYSIKFHIDGYSTGIMWLGWEDYIDTDLDISTMILVLENLKVELNKKGKEISVEELQEISTEDDYFKRCHNIPFEVSELIKILDTLIKMLKGTWLTDNYYLEINYL